MKSSYSKKPYENIMNILPCECLENACITSSNSNKVPKIIDSLSPSFPNIRRVKGDGNCYYRAVYYRYLEIILTSKSVTSTLEYLSNRIATDTQNNSGYFNLSKEEPSIFSLLQQAFIVLDETKNKYGIETTLKKLSEISNIGKFDYCMIRLLKRAVCNFLSLFPETQQIHGKPISMLIIGEEDESLHAYRVNVVLGEYSYSRNLICVILPLILRININIQIADLNEKSPSVIVEQKCPSQCEEIKLYSDKLLLFADSKIDVLLISEHYSLLYDEITIAISPLLESYYNMNDFTTFKQFEECTSLVIEKVTIPCCKILCDRKRFLKKVLEDALSNMKDIYNLKCPLCNKPLDVGFAKQIGVDQYIL